MSVITLPAAFIPTTCQLNMMVNQRVSASPFGGSEQAIDLLNDRWMMTCELSPRLMRDGAWLEAFIGQMRGQTNTTRVHHFVRPYPRGTARGTMLLNAAASQGARTIVVKDCVPSTGTLLAGDMLGVGGLLLMVAEDCTAVAGVITVPMTNALRVSQAINAPVTWSKPTVSVRMLDTSGVGYAPAIANGVSFDFGEAI